MLCGTALSFASFGLQVRVAPYAKPSANVLKTAVEAQIFLTFLVSFVLRALDASQVRSMHNIQPGYCRHYLFGYNVRLQ
eukprot:SAG31_NODE_1677_length_7533_cov_2.288054_4_plen_79_part_00